MKVMTRRRQALGWSQSRLSHATGIHASTISSIERGRLLPWPSQATRIARALGVPEDAAGELFEECEFEGVSEDGFNCA